MFAYRMQMTDCCDVVHQTYRVELADLNVDETPEYEGKLRKYKAELAQFDRRLSFVRFKAFYVGKISSFRYSVWTRRTIAEKAALMDGHKPADKSRPIEDMSASELIEESKKTQAQDTEAVDRMARLVKTAPFFPSLLHSSPLISRARALLAHAHAHSHAHTHTRTHARQLQYHRQIIFVGFAPFFGFLNHWAGRLAPRRR
jgi:hypothetical protein